MPLQNQSYATPNYLSSLQDKPKINLFDFASKPTLNVAPQMQSNIKPVTQFKNTTPTYQSSTKYQPNKIQTFLDRTKGIQEEESKRNAVIEMLKNGEDESFIEDTIINKMNYADSRFLGNKTFMGRLQEAGEGIQAREERLAGQDRNIFRQGLDKVGTAGLAVSGVVGAGFGELMETTGQGVRQGGLTEQVVGDVKDLGSKIAQSPVGDLAGTIGTGLGYAGKESFSALPQGTQEDFKSLGGIILGSIDVAGGGQVGRVVGKGTTNLAKDTTQAIKNKLPNMEEVRVNRATNKVDKGEDILFEAVNPTKQETKAVLRNRVQDLLPYIDNNPLKNSLDKVKGRIDVDNTKALTAMKNYENTTGVKGIVNTGDIIKKLQDKYQEKIGKSFIDSTEAKIAQDLIDTLKGFGKQVKDSDIIKIRRAWDKIEKKNKGFMQSAEATSKGDIIGDANKFFREEIRKSNPEYAQFLKDYSTTKTIGDIIEATIQRKTGQSGGYLRRGLETGARIAGAGSGGLPGYIASEALVQGSKALSSSAFKLTRGKKILQKGNKQVQSNKVKPKIIKNGVDNNGNSVTNNSSNRRVTNIPKKKTQVKKPVILTKSKESTIKSFIDSVKILDNKSIKKLSEKIGDTLGYPKKVIEDIIRDYVSKYGKKTVTGKNNLKDYIKRKLGDLVDNIADKTGARAKFMDDGGKGLDDFGGTTESSLIKEAKKYKSANEFIENQKLVYHGTTETLDSFDSRGTYFTDDFMNADGYAQGENIYEGYLDFKRPLIIDAKGKKWDEIKTRYGTSTQEVVGRTEGMGYDGVIFKNIKDNWIDDVDYQEPMEIYYSFDTSKSFKSEEQLKEIYNQANK